MDKKLVIKKDNEIQECIELQRKLVNEKGYPHFAPSSGVCWKCNRNIYQNYQIEDRISNGETGQSLVTGCPHCNRSYCD